MSIQRIQKDISEIKSFLQRNQISQSALARSLGVSAPMISQFLNGKYNGDDGSISQKINQYIDGFSEKSRQISKPPKKIFESRDKKMAEFVLSEAVKEGEFALLYGEAGCGKTLVVQEWVKTHPNTILIEATIHSSAGEILDELGEALNLSMPKNLNKRLRIIAKTLKQSDRVIIVDEAEHLPLRALEDLRRIADFSRVPLILVGTEILMKNLIGRNGELKQLYSRLSGKWKFKGLSKEETEEAFNPWIYGWTRGNFRSSSKLFNQANRLAELEGVEVNEEVVKAATEMIVIA